MKDIFALAATLIASVGGGGVIILGLSSWLGKIWAERLMGQETRKHDKELEALRNQLFREREQALAELRNELEITKASVLQDHTDKVAIYRAAIDLLAKNVAKIQLIIQEKRSPLTPQEELDFEEQRLRIYAYLAMHAPQSVMSAHDELTDMVLGVIDGTLSPTWAEFRELALKLLNEMRADIGVNPTPIRYQGCR